MVYPGYWEYAGTEVANSYRAAIYARDKGIDLRCPGCVVVPPGVYTDPVTDDAPWIDPAIPESARFLGVAGMDLRGLSASTRSRSVTQLADGGGRLTGLRSSHREILATVLLLAEDDAALSYGISWFTRAVADLACGSACTGDELRVVAYCPNGRPGEDPFRTLYDVGILEGPTMLERFRAGCGDAVGARMEVTLAAGQPWLYRTPQLVTTLTLGAAPTTSFDPLAAAVCSGAATCFDDPLCTPPPLPPVPALSVDPCWTGAAFTARRQVVTIPPELMSGWLETVPIIGVDAGDGVMRRLFARFFQPSIGGCSDPLDLCGYMGEFSLMYMAGETTLEVDGRTRQALGMCGGDVTAQVVPQLYGRAGAPFSWPVFACDTGACIEVAALSSAIASDATVTVSVAVREDAI